MRFGLFLEDAGVPRTVYYQHFREALSNSSRFVFDASQADVVFPAEDTAVETNWPRFGNPESAYVRGRRSAADVDAYLQRITERERPLCVLNMDPFRRVPLLLSEAREVIVADVNLLSWERVVNPRTISMPALPLTTGTPDLTGKRILASFRGAVSHPCRLALGRIHDGRDIVCELVARRNHARRIDAISGRIDSAYASLLAASVFAFVPRGDAHFSYRLLEVMSFGCIPVILADDLVPPFDRTVGWSRFCLQPSEAEIPHLPTILAQFSASRIDEMQREVAAVYLEKFSCIDRVVEALMDEVEAISAPRPHEVDSPRSPAGPEVGRMLAAYREKVAAVAARTPTSFERARRGLGKAHRWLGRLL